MQPLTAPVRTNPGPRAARGRWIWTLSGLATVSLLAVFGASAFARAQHVHGETPLSAVPTRTVIVPQAVTSLSVASYGAPIRVARGPVSQVTVGEAIHFEGQDSAPSVTATVSRGTLTLAAPSCVNTGCSVGFTVTVPASVTVNASSEGGQISVSDATTADLDSGGGPVIARAIKGAVTVTAEGGSITVAGASGADLDSGGGPITAGAVSGAITANADGGSITVTGSTGANLDSGGGPVIARMIGGPLTVSTDGGELQVDRLAEPLSADTGGGPVNASGIASATFQVTTDGGGARVNFVRAPRAVQVTTSGGPAVVGLPGGPYAVSAESFGGAEQVSVPVSPSAPSTVSVSTGGGELQVMPAGPGA
jgi:hypothetical protein